MNKSDTQQKAMMRNGNFLVEVDAEEVDALIAFSMKTDLEVLANDMQKRKLGEGLGFWSSDPKEDVKQFKRMIKAFKRVLWYYTGEHSELFEPKEK